ncbi:MAG: mycofactocin biosynthesis chaperone MftB [Candidatus Competibacter sp.]|nr:mycofactocin biosynthesis chaperone MftB [Candidatus Competibacteraceae bacterium]
MTANVEFAARYQLAPGVAIRPERFGGLVYRYDNRRLYFLRSRQTVELVNCLDGRRPLREILDEFVTERELPAAAREPLVAAVAQLEHLGLLTREN